MMEYHIPRRGSVGSPIECNRDVYLDGADDFYFWIYLKKIILRGDLTCFRLNDHPKTRPTAISLCKTKVSFVNRNKGKSSFYKGKFAVGRLLE